jgi:hypothetical protein
MAGQLARTLVQLTIRETPACKDNGHCVGRALRLRFNQVMDTPLVCRVLCFRRTSGFKASGGSIDRRLEQVRRLCSIFSESMTHRHFLVSNRAGQKLARLRRESKQCKQQWQRYAKHVSSRIRQ